MERESMGRIEKFRKWGDILNIALIAFGFSTAILDLAFSQTVGKEITKKIKRGGKK